MEIVCSTRFHLHEEELKSKVMELLRFHDDHHHQQEEKEEQQQPGVRRYSSGLKKKLLLEFKMMTDIDFLKPKQIFFHCRTLMQWMTKIDVVNSSHQSIRFAALKKSLCVKWENRKSRVDLTNSCFDDATEFEFCGDLKLVRYLRPLNYKDFEGNPALHHHLSTSTNTKQPRTLRVLLNNELTDANALNSGGSVALDIPCDQLNSDNMDIKFDMIRPEAGARACNLTNQRIEHNDVYGHRGLSNRSDLTNQEIEHNDDNSHRGLSNRSSHMITVKSIILSRNVLLLIATFFTTLTFQVPFHLLGRASKDDYVNNYLSGTFQMNKQYSILSNMFLFLNSMVFIASVVLTLFLLHEFPFKPWPQISISALFGSYMCSIKAISPNGALALLFMSIPFSLLAAAGKLYGFASRNFT